jgi:GNAT superfamily N-acetyltransferase
VYRRASLSNDGDRDVLLANPEFLDFEGRHLDDGRTRVIEVDDHIVGFATTIVSGSCLELEDLFVEPDWMRRGVARRLVADALDSADAAHYPALEVTANPHALEFYSEVGFIGTESVTTELGVGTRLRLEVPRH